MYKRNVSARWPFLGREAELELIASYWENSHTNGIAIIGPAGIGKSVLAEKWYSTCLERGYAGARVTATAAAAAVPLGALAHILPHSVNQTNTIKGLEELATSISSRIKTKRRKVLLLDDAHLLDDASAILLKLLVGTNDLRLIATMRKGAIMGPAVEDLISSETLQLINPNVLNINSVGSVLEAALGGRISQSAIYDFHKASQGNPLFLRELALGALSMGALIFSGQSWNLIETYNPGTPKLSETIRSRLEELGQEHQPAIDLLALCGEVSRQDLELVTSPSGVQELKNSGVINIIKSGMRSGVVLSHPLYGEVVRERITTIRRRIILMRHIERIEGYGARRREDSLQLATWKLSIYGTADPDLLKSGAALAREAHDYDKVINLLNALPKEHQSLRTKLLYGEALIEAGKWINAEAFFAEAIDSAKDEEEDLQITISRTLNMLWSNAQTSTALRINQDALKRLPSERSQNILKINEDIIWVVSGKVTAAKKLCQRLTHSPDNAPDLNIWLTGLLMAAIGMTAAGIPTDALAWSKLAYKNHSAANKQALVPHPSSQRIAECFALTELGEIASARRVGEEVFSSFLESRAPLPRIWMAYFLGHCEWIAGRPKAAHRWFSESVSLSRIQGQDRALRLALSGMAATVAVIGDVDRAEEINEESKKYPSIGFLAGQEDIGRVWLAASEGDIRKAQGILVDAISLAQSTGHISASALLITDLARLGRADQAIKFSAYQDMETVGELGAVRKQFIKALASRSAENLQETALRCEMLGLDLMAAEAFAAAATEWRKLNSVTKASYAARKSREFISLSGGIRTPLITGEEAFVSLTSREREVALMAARGASSKQIASILDLSTRTVDNHLQKVYTKLGISRRRELTKALEGS